MKTRLLILLLCLSLSSCAIFRKVNKTTEEVKTEVKVDVKDSIAIKKIDTTSIIDTTDIYEIDIDVADTSKPLIIDGVKYINIKRFKAIKTKKGITYQSKIDSTVNQLKIAKSETKVSSVSSSKQVDKKSFDFIPLIIIIAICVYIRYQFF